MRVLIACECSGIVRDAFIAAGHDAISCDLKPSRVGGPHHQGDVREILYEPWDLLIAHPVCRYLANSGAKHLYKRIDGVWAKENGRDEERWQLMKDGASFFRCLDRADHIPMRAIENPVMHGPGLALIGRRASQYIQPWMFGDPFSKMTGLWLTRLPPLRPEKRKSDYGPGEIKQEVFMMPPSPDREERRSVTYPGIARAFAEQWGSLKRPYGFF